MVDKLTKQDVDFYNKNGFFLYHKPLFSDAKLAKLEGIFQEHLVEKGSKLSDELDTPHFRDERLLDFLLSDEALDLVEPILGPNIIMWTSHFICKDPYVGRVTPWHEDSAYWAGRFDKYDKIATIWLALDHVSKENGCMRVIPGTHTNGFSEYEEVDSVQNTFHAKIKNIDMSEAYDFEIEKGECSIHDSRIIHGANANKSPYRRLGYTMRYISADTKVLPVDKNKDWKIWLARGKNVAGNKCVNET